MVEEKQIVSYRWFEEVGNNGRAEVTDEMIAPTVVAHGHEDPDDE